MTAYEIIETDASSLMRMYDLGPLSAKLLQAADLSDEQIREILSEDSALTFSNASCVTACCERLLEARKNNEKVFVGGDYDADGICSTAIMKRTLDRLGIQNGYYIPDRFREGYGLKKETVTKAAEKGYTVIMTVDNGVKAQEAIAEGKKLGMTVIITDHHRIEEEVDADILVHPDFMEDRFSTLSGAGVALEISRRLIGEDDVCTALAAVAAVGDIMPLWKETRKIVRNGIQILKTGAVPALSALLYDPQKTDETAIAFQIVPKLNSVGRMNDISNVNTLVPFLLSTDPKVISRYTIQLNQVNEMRKQLSDAEAREAEQYCTDSSFEIIYRDSFHEGLCGLVAGKLAGRYHKPVVILAKGESLLKGSGRSVPGFDLFAFLGSFTYLQAFGGHEQAVGLSIAPEDLDAFTEAVQAKMKETDFVYEEPVTKAILVRENEIGFDQITEMERLKPLPKELSDFVFAVRGPEILERREMNKVTKYRLQLAAGELEAVLFRWRNITEPQEPQYFIGRFSVNRWRNQITCQMETEAIL